MVKGVVKESDHTMGEYRPKRCFRILEEIIARKKPKKLVSFKTMRNAREKSINHIMLDMIVIRMKLLNINSTIKDIQDKIKMKNGSVRDESKKPVVAMIKGNVRVKELEGDKVPVLSLSLIHI